MKLLFLISFAFIYFSSFSQKARVQEENFSFSVSSNANSFSVEIPYVQTKDDESIESKSFPNLFTFFYLGSKYLIRVFLTILRN